MQKFTKKFSTRPSPPYEAPACAGETKRGNDGNMWTSIANKNGIYTWRPTGSASASAASATVSAVPARSRSLRTRSQTKTAATASTKSAKSSSSKKKTVSSKKKAKTQSPSSSSSKKKKTTPKTAVTASTPKSPSSSSKKKKNKKQQQLSSDGGDSVLIQVTDLKALSEGGVGVEFFTLESDPEQTRYVPGSAPFAARLSDNLVAWTHDFLMKSEIRSYGGTVDPSSDEVAADDEEKDKTYTCLLGRVYSVSDILLPKSHDVWEGYDEEIQVLQPLETYFYHWEHNRAQKMTPKDNADDSLTMCFLTSKQVKGVWKVSAALFDD